MHAFSLQPVAAAAQRAYTAVPTKLKLCGLLAVSVGGAAYGYWQAYKNFKTLDVANDVFETPFRVQTSFWLSLWNIDQWSSAAAIKSDSVRVQRELTSAVHGRSLRVKSEDGSIKIISTWLELQDALVKEIDMLNAKQQKLEKNYLVYGKALSKTGFGIVRDYKHLCAVGLDHEQVPSYAMHHWPVQTYGAIDAAMLEQVCVNHWWHWFSRPNYGMASRLWWQLLTLSYRLAALQEIVNAQIEAERGVVCQQVVIRANTITTR
jgi:hypothetical protein